MEEKIKICPLCGMRFVWGKCDCGYGEFYDALVDARYWAGKMYRRALEAEEMLHNLAETGLVASFEDACKITKLKSENAALRRKLQDAEAEIANLQGDYIGEASDLVDAGLQIDRLTDRVNDLSRKLAIAEEALTNEYTQHEHIHNQYAQGAARIAKEALWKMRAISETATNPPSVTLDDFGMDENARCPDCGGKMQIVRPGKYQCVGECCYG